MRACPGVYATPRCFFSRLEVGCGLCSAAAPPSPARACGGGGPDSRTTQAAACPVVSRGRASAVGKRGPGPGECKWACGRVPNFSRMMTPCPSWQVSGQTVVHSCVRARTDGHGDGARDPYVPVFLRVQTTPLRPQARAPSSPSQGKPSCVPQGPHIRRDCASHSFTLRHLQS